MKFTISKQSGFTLIEILISMLVLAIGLLGLAGITVVVMRSNTLSQQVADATNVASDLMDRVRRANPGSITAYSTNCLTVIATPTASSCAIIASSGLVGLNGSAANSINFYPQVQNGINPSGSPTTECGLRGIVGPAAVTSALTFDIVNSSTLTTVGTTTTSSDICALSSNTLAANQYVRYFRTYWPGGTASSTDRTIIVVVLWKDKFGKWRNVHLSTSQ